MPVLTVNGTFDTWSMVVADDVPPAWQLQNSIDGGATWNDIDDTLYGNDINDAQVSGVLVRASRADGAFNAFGPTSNVIAVP